MSNPILTSNQSSAVVATINESKTYSPWVYNETHRLVSPHAMQVLSVSPTSSSVAPGRTYHFDIPKNGLLQGLYMQLDVEYVEDDGTTAYAPAVGDCMPPLGLLECIDRIRLTTSGRIIEELDRAQIMARYADLPIGQKRALLQQLRAGNQNHEGIPNISYGANMPNQRSGFTINSQPKPLFWLPFYFSQSPERYALFTNFVEPHTVEIVLTDGKIILDKNATGANTTFAQAKATGSTLYCHYRQLEEPQINEVVQKNYGSGLHTQIVNISRREAHTDYTQGDAAGIVTKTVELKESEAITSMHFFVEQLREQPGADDTALLVQSRGKPLDINHVSLKFANTTVIDVPGEFLRCYGRWNMGSEQGDGSLLTDDGLGVGVSNLHHVYKIDFSLDRPDGQVSNVVSLREISNPTLSVTWGAVASASYRIHVVYNTATFLTTSSATGRVNLSISS